MDINATNHNNANDSDIENGLDSSQMFFAGILVVLAAFGIGGNIALIRNYQAKNLKVRFNCLMLFLAICDLTYLISIIVVLIVVETVGEVHFLHWLCEVFFACSVYTTTAITLERYLVFCKDMNTEKFPIKRVILTIILSAIILMSPYYMWYSTNYIYFAITMSFQFLFQACIPALIMVKCNVSLYQQLKNVQKSNNLTASTNESIRKSVFRAKFTLSITAIFIIGSMITWLPSLPNDLIHWKPEQFQELESETSIFVVIGVLVYVINCSGNYFVYKYLKWKETKVKKPKSQFHVDLTQSTNQSNLSSAV